jgi:hypothetical protein
VLALRVQGWEFRVDGLLVGRRVGAPGLQWEGVGRVLGGREGWSSLRCGGSAGTPSRTFGFGADGSF